MALKIRTVMTYPLNGSTVDFMIPFEYLARKFVTVTLIGQTRKELVLNQDYRFTTKNQITTSRGWGSNDGFDLIEIRRYTSATERLVDFADGSILRAYDLNISQVQTLHVAEEARDLTADTIGVNNDGHLDARGRRIVNVADAVGDFDAVNMNQMKRWDGSALNSANKAAASERNAQQHAQNALDAKAVTQGFRNESETFKNQAQQADQQAYQHRLVAENAARNSENSYQASIVMRNETENFKNQANGFKNDAAGSAAIAKEYGDKVVEGMHTLGSIPVGTVIMVLRGNPPIGFIECGMPFDVKAYPALAKIFPEGSTPTFHNRFPRGYASNPQSHETGKGAHGEQSLPPHNHEVRVKGNVAESGGGRFWTSGGGGHHHDTGIPFRNGTGPYDYAGYVRHGANGQYPGTDVFPSSEVGDHNHFTDIPNHGHYFEAMGNTLGNGGQIGAGHNHLTPYNVGVMFCIKAYEGVAELDQATVIVGTMVSRVDALEARAVAAESRVAVLEERNHATWLIAADDVEFATKRVETVWYSDFSRIIQKMHDSGKLPQNIYRATMLLTLQMDNKGIGIYGQRVSAIVEVSAGTNDEHLLWLPTTTMGHALNAPSIRLGVQMQSAGAGGDPHLKFIIDAQDTMVSRGNYQLYGTLLHWF